MPEQPHFDLLIVDADIPHATYCAGRLHREGAVRTLVHGSARDALAAFSRTRLDAIVGFNIPLHLLQLITAHLQETTLAGRLW